MMLDGLSLHLTQLFEAGTLLAVPELYSKLKASSFQLFAGFDYELYIGNLYYSRNEWVQGARISEKAVRCR
jgi:hypothetical protein